MMTKKYALEKDILTLAETWREVATMSFETKNDLVTASLMFRGFGFSVVEIDIEGAFFLKVSMSREALCKECDRVESK